MKSIDDKIFDWFWNEKRWYFSLAKFFIILCVLSFPLGVYYFFRDIWRFVTK